MKFRCPECGCKEIYRNKIERQRVHDSEEVYFRIDVLNEYFEYDCGQCGFDGTVSDFEIIKEKNHE